MTRIWDQLFSQSGVPIEQPDTFPWNEALLSEKVDGILASPAFMRAPVLSRLLRYLLDKTIAGEADTLKAYTVAVDGLSRPPDFDPQFDSYPRVQMVRLRRAIETYYFEQPELADPCVFLCARSYRLQLVRRQEVYNFSRVRRLGRSPVVRALSGALPKKGFWYEPVPRWVALIWCLVFAGLSAAVMSFHHVHFSMG